MSEMSAEKKKQIENYIVNSYFGGGKNIEAYVNGADLITGSCGIPDLLVKVESFNDEMMTVHWDILSEFGSEYKNEFMMVIARERKIERNRCDSVDSMVYAWEAWRAKILGKPVFLETNEKDKRIEELEKEIKALRAEKEVMERHIQELESHNVSLAETNAVLNNKLNKLDPMPEFKELLKKLYSTDDVEKLAWTLNHVCGGRGSVNGWIAVSTFWKQNCETLSKLVGFSSVEEIQDYLTNEANCDTLHEAISNLHDEVKYTSNEWKDMNEELKECKKDYISKRDEAKRLEKEIGIYNRALKEWKESTGCPSPSAAKTTIECMASWHHAYDDAKKEIESLKAALKTSNSAMQKELDSEIDNWQKATGCESPDKVKSKINELETKVKNLNDRLGRFIQAASCAEKHLENVLVWKPEQTGQEVE